MFLNMKLTLAVARLLSGQPDLTEEPAGLNMLSSLGSADRGRTEGQPEVSDDAMSQVNWTIILCF